MASESIIAIHSYLSEENEAGQMAGQAFYLMYLFDENGILDQEPLRNVYYELFSKFPQDRSKGFVGPFENMTALNQYALAVCENMNSHQICLLPLKEYNSVMEEVVESPVALRNSLITRGNCIENLEKGRKKGIFSKIFN